MGSEQRNSYHLISITEIEPEHSMGIEYFHRWLADHLWVRSDEIRDRFSDRLPTALELDSILLLETLADDVVNVSEHVFTLFQMMLLMDGIGENFEAVSYALLQRVGVDVVPHDASDLVRWLMIEALHGRPDQQRAPSSKSVVYSRHDRQQPLRRLLRSTGWAY